LQPNGLLIADACLLEGDRLETSQYVDRRCRDFDGLLLERGLFDPE
jgi:hypothetical protein